jgi:hypothetical protein
MLKPWPAGGSSLGESPRGTHLGGTQETLTGYIRESCGTSGSCASNRIDLCAPPK